MLFCSLCALLLFSTFTLVHFYSCPLLLLSTFTLVHFYSCPLLLLSTFTLVHFYSCPLLLLSTFTLVHFYSSHFLCTYSLSVLLLLFLSSGFFCIFLLLFFFFHQVSFVYFYYYFFFHQVSFLYFYYYFFFFRQVSFVYFPFCFIIVFSFLPSLSSLYLFFHWCCKCKSMQVIKTKVVLTKALQRHCHVTFASVQQTDRTLLWVLRGPWWLYHCCTGQLRAIIGITIKMTTIIIIKVCTFTFSRFDVHLVVNTRWKLMLCCEMA